MMIMGKPPKALLTGCNGFVGRWLTDYLHSIRYEVHGVDLQVYSDHPLISYHHVDILENEKIAALVTELQPAMIFHLAAVTYLPDADHSPRQSIEINIFG